MMRVVTDEGIDNFELEYPVADLGGIIKAEEFGRLWSLNNKSYVVVMTSLWKRSASLVRVWR